MIFYLLFITIGYIFGLFIGFKYFNHFHGPDSSIIKKIKYMEYNNDTINFYKLKPIKIFY